MLSVKQISRESKSRIYLSQKSQEEKDVLMAQILVEFSKNDGGFPSDRMDELYLLIRKLKDCAYLRCGVDSALRETYRTTDSGKVFLKSLQRVD